MAQMSGEGTLSVGARLDAAGQALQRVTSTRSTSWNVESADPQERAARAAERGLELGEATRDGIAALVAAAKESADLARAEARWVIRTAKLTMVIVGLTFVTLLVAIATLFLTA